MPQQRVASPVYQRPGMDNVRTGHAVPFGIICASCTANLGFMKRSTLFTALLLTTVAATAQYTATVKSSVTKVENSAWRKWSDAASMMNYPSGWTSHGSGVNDRAASFQAPNLTDGPRERVELFVKPAAGHTLQEAAAAAEADAANVLDKAKVVTSAANGDKHLIDLTGEEQGSPVRMRREIRVMNDRVWVLVYSAPPAQFEENLYLAEAMFASFKVK